MPELPELEVLRETVGPRITGRRIAEVVVSPRYGFLLRSPVGDFAARLRGRTVSRMWRRGKFLVVDVVPDSLVINPMLGGRLQWAAHDERVAAATVFRMRFEDDGGDPGDPGDELRFLDTARMGRVYLVAADGGLEQVPGFTELGPEALEIGEEEFARRIRRHPGELKNLLRNQAFVAGVGNAYSDEILFEARLLPLRRRSSLRPGEVAALYGAMRSVLEDAIAAIRAQPGYEPHKQDRTFMRVHGRGGQDCPRCGHRISSLGGRGEETNFCRGCQV